MAIETHSATIKSSQTEKQKETSALYRELALTRATEAILQTKVVDLEYPGGKSRESYRMVLENDSVIATRRSSLQLARTEVMTISALNKHDAAVPKLLGTNHSKILIQEEIKGERLSLTLNQATEEQAEQLLTAALESLAAIHRAASKENLETLVRTLGEDDAWIEILTEQPAKTGEPAGVAPPALDKRRLISLLKVTEPRFVKWDSRPGNALVAADGRVYWFDWEHAGSRNRLDDMAWVLGDEFVPEWVAVEGRLLEKFLPLFKGQMSVDEAREYLMAYGAFHMSVRLGLILRNMEGEWWDLDYCIENDKIGVTLLCAQRLCQRGFRWASTSELTQDLARWFSDMESFINDLETS